MRWFDSRGAQRIVFTGGGSRRRIELCDVAGHARAELRQGAEGAGMAMLNPAGEAEVWLAAPAEHLPFGWGEGQPLRARLEFRDEGPSITLEDQPGVRLASLDAGSGGVVRLAATGAARPWLRVVGEIPCLSLFDAAGRVRGELAVDDDGPYVTLADSQERPGAQLRLRDDGAGVALLAPSGESRAWFGITADGSSYLGLLAGGGQLNGQWAIEGDEVALHLLDAAGARRAELRVDSSGPRLTLAGANRRARAQIRLGSDGPGIAFLDNQGETRGWLGLIAEEKAPGMSGLPPMGTNLQPIEGGEKLAG